MEQIMINITGRGAEEQKAKIMKAVYKVLARENDSRCHIDISSRRMDAPAKEIMVPQVFERQQVSAMIERRVV